MPRHHWHIGNLTNKTSTQKREASNIGCSGFSLGELPFNIPCKPLPEASEQKVFECLGCCCWFSSYTKVQTNRGLAVFPASSKWLASMSDWNLCPFKIASTALENQSIPTPCLFQNLKLAPRTLPYAVWTRKNDRILSNTRRQAPKCRASSAQCPVAGQLALLLH